MELVVTEVEGGVDGFEGFKVDVDFTFFAFVCDDGTAVKDEPVLL